ncbi:hypothetical protein ABZ845_06915 [Streptomyces sp. NPDC047022]|uniref:hypothetical protein n=1 Tax=Streptomyces sp. NPDC047022 TaxID=3155737 RepID=UPI0034020B1F
MSVIDAGISTATGGACVGTAGVLYLADRLPGLSHIATKVQGPRAQVLLVLTAAIGLVATPAGAWWNERVTAANTWAASWVGEWTGIALTFIPALFLLLLLISDFRQDHIRGRTLLLAATVPPLTITIPGNAGAFIADALGFIASLIGGLIAWLFNIG